VVGIAQTDQLQIQYVGDLSAYLSDIEIGMPVVLRYQGAPVQARVAVTPLTAPTPPVDSNPRRAEILGKTLVFDFVDAIPSSLSIGDNIEFKLLLTRKDNVLIIPRGALRHYQGRQFVQILEGETRRQADVQVGLMTPTEVEIVRGLKEGQQIIVNH
jgi:sRNA-binding carbon storage regulator CsrA